MSNAHNFYKKKGKTALNWRMKDHSTGNSSIFDRTSHMRVLSGIKEFKKPSGCHSAQSAGSAVKKTIEVYERGLSGLGGRLRG